MRRPHFRLSALRPFLCAALTASDYCGSKQTIPISIAYGSGVVPVISEIIAKLR